MNQKNIKKNIKNGNKWKCNESNNFMHRKSDFVEIYFIPF